MRSGPSGLFPGRPVLGSPASGSEGAAPPSGPGERDPLVCQGCSARRFQRSVLDLSLQWRFANLPNNAKLEMVPVSRSREGPQNTVRIAVQLEDGARLQGAFCSGQTLWELLSHFPQTRECGPHLAPDTTAGHTVAAPEMSPGKLPLRGTSWCSVGEGSRDSPRSAPGGVPSRGVCRGVWGLAGPRLWLSTRCSREPPARVTDV
uniref:TUG ubiquitin-like domain-containing protein n=1 Tax=Oryctolagus cuniculus TaxID=9986 RepID=G1TQW1_RABIT